MTWHRGKGLVRWELRDSLGNYLADIVRRECSKVPWCYRAWTPDNSKSTWGYVASVARAKREAVKWLDRHVR